MKNADHIFIYGVQEYWLVGLYKYIFLQKSKTANMLEIGIQRQNNLELGCKNGF
jgi:hypothetical protein